jgi:hypothetical protein
MLRAALRAGLSLLVTAPDFNPGKAAKETQNDATRDLIEEIRRLRSI